MRIRVSDVLELLADGMTAAQILDEHLDLEIEDIHACLRFASHRVAIPSSQRDLSDSTLSFPHDCRGC